MALNFVFKICLIVCSWQMVSNALGKDKNAPLQAWVAPQADDHPRKLALLVGISQYPARGGWSPIHGREDAVRMDKTLRQQGFVAPIMLTEEGATKVGIVLALRTMAQTAQAGDMVFVLLAGHGQQLSDDNAEEPDGWDECFIPYDCPLYTGSENKGYDGGQHLRDDELDALLTAIRQKVGSTGQVFVAIDACHSGSVTRAFPVKASPVPLRGGQDPLILPQARRVDALVPVDGNRLAGESGLRQAGLAPMVAFFATAAGEDNAETKDAQEQPAGPLSYALSNILGAAPKQVSYQRLFEAIQLEMRRHAYAQNPTAEGELNRAFFDGHLLGNVAHFLVTGQPDPEYALLQSGTLLNLYPETELAFYPPDTWDIANAKPWAKGIITKSDPTGAMIRLDQAIHDEQLKGAWAYIVRLPYDKPQLLKKLRDLRWDDPNISLHCELVPYACNPEDGTLIRDLPRPVKDSLGLLPMFAGDCIKLRVQNTSGRPLYIALLDVMRDSVSLLIPEKGQQHFAIAAGETWDSGTKNIQWTLAPPYGIEVFKVVASDQPLPAELRQVTAVRGGGTNSSVQVQAGCFEIVDILVNVLKKK